MSRRSKDEVRRENIKVKEKRGEIKIREKRAGGGLGKCLQDREKMRVASYVYGGVLMGRSSSMGEASRLAMGSIDGSWPYQATGEARCSCWGFMGPAVDVEPTLSVLGEVGPLNCEEPPTLF